MQELATGQVEIRDQFWRLRLEINARQAIYHQWDQLVATGCIENFRLLVEGKEGFREGWVFADSDAYKWIDAACRIYARAPSEELERRIEKLTGLIAAAQTGDGYLFSYNQLHFPGVRWTNLQIEHELYCLGHLIEAAISHFEATGGRDLLAVALKAADLMVSEFLGKGASATPGHQEVELALIKLYRVTRDDRYLALAEQFLEQRGRIKAFPAAFHRQNASARQRARWVEAQRAAYLLEHPEHAAFQLAADNPDRRPPWSAPRRALNQIRGLYAQQHRPVRQQTVPVGHAVRFAYLETALAMLARERGDEDLLDTLEAAWDRMVERRMYVTGGLGALPGIEGFGRDYELDAEYAYAETCAALGSLFWNWEMSLITGQACYADLFEWQLYNAASVGMGADGRSYLYNNPLTSAGGITRQPWFEVPCCPSNLSRTWAHLDRYIYSYQGSEIWVHQYVGSRATVHLAGADCVFPVAIELCSRLPWQGAVSLELDMPAPSAFTLHLRVPSWAGSYRLRVNGQPVAAVASPDANSGDAHTRGPNNQGASTRDKTASGYDPRGAFYVPIRRTWSPGDRIELDLPLELTVRRAHPKVRGRRGKVALTRGPSIYCLESIDNPGLDLFSARLDLESLSAEPVPHLFEGIWVLRGRTQRGSPVTAIPYAWWANRGESQMTILVRS